jgi:predicted  nucleic acid-binding Zn-ribbon protein
MRAKQIFHCVSCHTVYANGGRYDLPRCPRCGCHSSLFPEWLKARRPAD